MSSILSASPLVYLAQLSTPAVYHFCDKYFHVGVSVSTLNCVYIYLAFYSEKCCRRRRLHTNIRQANSSVSFIKILCTAFLFFCFSIYYHTFNVQSASACRHPKKVSARRRVGASAYAAADAPTCSFNICVISNFPPLLSLPKWLNWRDSDYFKCTKICICYLCRNRDTVLELSTPELFYLVCRMSAMDTRKSLYL